MENGDASTLTGVLLINLGTPDAPDVPALRRYLAEFLADPDVVTLPRLLWLPLLYLVVLRTRPAKSAEAYRRIWTEQGSPLLVNSRALAAKLGRELQLRGRSVPVVLGMRYGRPSLMEVLAALKQRGVTRLLALPLYPQYAAATTGSSLRAVDKALQRLAWKPELLAIRDYHAAPGYLDALADSVRHYWREHGRGERLVISFHGIPKQVAERGDPYAAQCAATAQALAVRLKLEPSFWQLAFQSRFGPAEWLQPYTEEILRHAAAQGVRRVDVICPGFAADCLETLEEIALRYAESYRAAGGAELRYIPALNARDSHVHALTGLILERLGTA